MNLVGPRDSEKNTTGTMVGPSGEQDDRSTDKLASAAAETKESSDATPTYGRRGDPRMHRALAAKQSNPKMTLLDALLTGGFVFPDLGDPGMSDRTIRDTDNVLLYQRKNQLNRRLRLARSTPGHDRGKRSATSKLGDGAGAAGDGSKKALAPAGKDAPQMGGMPPNAMGQHQPFMGLPLEMQQNLQHTLLSMGAVAGQPPPASAQDKSGTGGAAAGASPSAVPGAAAAGGGYPGQGDLMSMAYFFAQQQQLQAQQQQQLQQQQLQQQQLQGINMQQQQMAQGMNKFNNAALLAASLVAGQGGAAAGGAGAGGAAPNVSEGGKAGTDGGGGAAAGTDSTEGGPRGEQAFTPSWQAGSNTKV